MLNTSGLGKYFTKGHMMSVQYMVLYNGQQFGPYEIEQITAMFQAGDIDANTLIWCDAWTEWVPITNVIPPQIQRPFVAIRAVTTLAYSSPRKRPAKSPNTMPWFICGTALVIALLAGLWAYENNQHPPKTGNGAPPIGLATKTPELSDLKFSISRKSDDGGGTAWWEIVNHDHEQLVVKCVTFNGEFAASRGKWALFRAVTDNDQSYPISIGTGETGYIMIFSSDGSNAANYSKSIGFMNIDTNRGKFRCRPGGLPERID